jgi:hypothetical protein
VEEIPFCNDAGYAEIADSASYLSLEFFSPLVAILPGIVGLYILHFISQQTFSKRMAEMQVEVDTAMDEHSAKLALQDLDRAGTDISEIRNVLTSIQSYFECNNFHVQTMSRGDAGAICMCRYCHVVAEIREKMDKLIKDKDEAWDLIKERAKVRITGYEIISDVELELPPTLKGSSELEAFLERNNEDRKACWESCFSLRKGLERCEEERLDDSERALFDAMKLHLERATASGLADATLLDAVRDKIKEISVPNTQLIVQPVSSLSISSAPCASSSGTACSLAELEEVVKSELPGTNGAVAALGAILLMQTQMTNDTMLKQTQMTIMENQRRDSYKEAESAKKEARDRQLRQDNLRKKIEMKWELEEKRNRDRESRDQMKIEADRVAQIEVLRYKENMRLEHEITMQRKEKHRIDRDMLVCFGCVVFASAICNRFLPLHSVLDALKTVLIPRSSSFPQWISLLNLGGSLDRMSHFMSTILFFIYLAPFLSAVLILSKIKDMSRFTQATLLIIFIVFFFQHIKPMLAKSHFLVLIPAFAELLSRALSLIEVKWTQTKPSRRVRLILVVLLYYSVYLFAYMAMAVLGIILSDLLLCAEQTMFECYGASLNGIMKEVRNLWWGN